MTLLRTRGVMAVVCRLIAHSHEADVNSQIEKEALGQKGPVPAAEPWSLPK